MKSKIEMSLSMRAHCARITQRLIEYYDCDVPMIAANDQALAVHHFNVCACELSLLDWKLDKKENALISLRHSQAIALYLLSNSNAVLSTLDESGIFTAREVNYALFMEIINYNPNKI